MSPDWVVFAKGAMLWIALCVGSFINVLAHRFPVIFLTRERQEAQAVLGLPIEPDPTETLSHPRSRCPHCKSTIPAHLNIPIIGWFLARGRCGSCSSKISFRYPAIEIIAGAWALGVVVVVESPVSAAFYVSFGLLLLAAAALDLSSHLLPNAVTVPIIALGIGGALLGVGSLSTEEAVIAGALVALVWVLLDNLALALRGHPLMADGDWKLLIGIATVVGMAPLLPMMLVASLLLCLHYIVFRPQDRELPFGPAIAAAGALASAGIFEPIISFYRAWI